MRRLVSCLALAVTAACGQDVTVNEVFNLDRPVAAAFGCWGDLRITAGAAPTGAQTVTRSAMPVSVCRDFTAYNRLPITERTAEDLEILPESQRPIDDNVPDPQQHVFTSFVLQTTKGTVALVEQATDGSGLGGVGDADHFAPGRNAIPVGALPVDLALTPDSCHVVTANAGSCDLSSLDINSAVDRDVPARVVHVQPTSASGEAIVAKPAAIVAEPAWDEVGYLCPEQAQGLVYVAYPDCNLVAAIDATTGEVVAGVRFGDGTVEITGGDVTCNRECGDGALASRITVGGPGRPTSLFMSSDGARLYIGAENLPAVTWVELDGAGRPVSIDQVVLEGEVGVRRLSVSPAINMGGTVGFGEGSAGVHRFAYAIATDDTVRVVEVRSKRVECETQADPRYLADVTDVGFLACMPVGDLATPPRRGGRHSPGVHLPGDPWSAFDGVPLDVTFIGMNRGFQCPGPNNSTSETEYCGNRMIGYFALISAADGEIYAVTVDDDTYPDFEIAGAPLEVDISLAAAHQLRDLGSQRRLLDINNDTPTCTNRPGESPGIGGPRVANTVARVFDTSRMTAEKSYQQPTIRNDLCMGLSTGNEPVPTTSLASDLSFTATPAQRKAAFPDLMMVTTELVRLTWEGLVSLDSSLVSIDGLPTRVGLIDVASGELTIEDPNRPFCRAGVEPYDIISLEGCDPSRGNSECSLGFACTVHPNTPASIGSGTCLPEAEASQLLGTCERFMTSHRRYTLTETNVGDVTAMPRRVVLEQTPLAGCDSADQCQTLHRMSVDLGAAEHPAELRTATCDQAQNLLECPDGYVCQGTSCVLEESFTWACEEDPTRRPGKSWCVMTCDQDADCSEGDVCDGSGYCVTGPAPPPECVEGLQRYRLRVGEAYALLGEFTGFRHNRIYDEGTGACIDDPTPDPLLVGRVPLTAPPCTGDGPTDLSPNPCSVTVSHTDIIPDLSFTDGRCVLTPGNDTGQTYVTRDVPAIRVQTPGMRFHLANVGTPGDANCIGDMAAGMPLFPAVHQGSQVRFDITGGFVPARAQPGARLPTWMRQSPDGTIWVLDQGDVSRPTQGQILRLILETPDNNGLLFQTQAIQ